jgi:hypothetical protein
LSFKKRFFLKPYMGLFLSTSRRDVVLRLTFLGGMGSFSRTPAQGPKVNLKTHLKKIMLSLSLYCHVFSVGM